jgi:predicted lipoprotein with Yx(FWY)xxD motif
MHRLGVVFVSAVLIGLSAPGLAQAQSNTQVNPPCTPPPGSASAIVCFGETPCPPGYIDPVGTRLRSLAGIAGQNPMLPPDQQRWLCQQAPASSDSSSNESAAANTAEAPAPTGPKVASTTVQVLNNAAVGQYLADPYGMTLYTRSADPPGASTCAGSCSIIWIALQPPAGSLTLPSSATGTIGVITRDDGTQQVTYNGAPLYVYTGDLQPGDVNGTIAGAYQPATP